MAHSNSPKDCTLGNEKGNKMAFFGKRELYFWLNAGQPVKKQTALR